jgi:hypothetical protein
MSEEGGLRTKASEAANSKHDEEVEVGLMVCGGSGGGLGSLRRREGLTFRLRDYFVNIKHCHSSFCLA